jgi:hypothetical protein
MIEHPTVVTRARYLATWGSRPIELRVANRVFDRFVGTAGADHIAPDPIKADLDRVAVSAEHLREYAERTRAHRSPPGQRVDTARLTFGALHEAIASVRDVVGKYYALLTQRSIGQWESVPQYDTLAAFMQPWILDRAAVQRAIEEAGRT